MLATKLKGIFKRKILPESYKWKPYQGKYGQLWSNRWTSELTGEKEIHKMAFLNKNVKPGEVFIDIGAHIGYYTTFAMNKGLTVYAFEPNPDIFLRLKANCKLNSGDAHLFPFAISNQNKKTTLCVTPVSILCYLEGSFDSRDFEKKVPVQAIRLDDFIKEHKLDRIDWIKIDVEGHEKEVIEGMKQTLQKFRPIVLIEGDNLQELIGSILKQTKYKLVPHKSFLDNNRSFRYLLMPIEKIKK